jgi:serine/threonine-protein kinase RsbW
MKIEHKEILKTDKTAISRIEPILDRFKKTFGVPDEKFYNIMIAVSEAINNAINHGNQFDPEKNVFFELDADEDKITIKVKDEGEGFDLDNVADCTDPENLLKSSGRGVYLIRELMHDVDFDISNGTQVEMTFFLK